MLFAVLDNATAFFLSIPLLLIYIKSMSQVETAWHWSMPLWLLNYNAIRYFVSDGEVFWVVLYWQLLFIWPISIAIYIHLYNKEKKWAFYIGLMKKHVLIVLTLIVIFGSSLVYSLYQTNLQVINFHKQVMQEIEDTPDRHHYLILNTITPTTLLQVVDDISIVRHGQLSASTFPWSSKVIVYTDNWKKEFTYVRFNDGWKLDGLYQESSIKYTND
ncbi:hypothetical protein ACQKNX_05285 [Lysinibacillus sp. NPDC093712]|uniref:hypothetical protein n=1 Tax=Lysinibacillus sp. NPDC093712 TaxID=3390579 RepID=UPI003D05904B